MLAVKWKTNSAGLKMNAVVKKMRFGARKMRAIVWLTLLRTIPSRKLLLNEIFAS